MKKYLLLGAALGMIGMPAFAADAPKPATPPSSGSAPPVVSEGDHGSVSGHAPGEGRMMGMIAHLDTDHDGKVSKAEFLAGAEKHFEELDANHDGFITPDEMASKREEIRAKMMEHREKMEHGNDEGKATDAPAPSNDPPKAN